MNGNKNKCLYCERTSAEVPILVFEYRDDTYGICPQHLPVLIHKPEQLAQKLPGAESFGPSEGHDH